MANKTSSNNQIGILKSKGLIINNPVFVRDLLERKGYYNIINAFKNLFLDPIDSKRYIQNTTFEEIYSVYKFDICLRNLFLKYILIFENEFKSLMVNVIVDKHNSCSYFSDVIYDNKSKSKLKKYQENIFEIYMKNKTNQMIEHYLNKGEMVPLWALINLFDFGNMRTFYDLLEDSIKNKITKKYGLSNKALISALSTLNLFRNICAHNNRIYNYKINNDEMQLSDLDVHYKLNIPKDKNNKYIKGKNDLFAVLISLKYLLSKDDFNDLVNELETSINTLKSNLKVISIDKILNEMGFIKEDISINQKDWKKIINI